MLRPKRIALNGNPNQQEELRRAQAAEAAKPAATPPAPNQKPPAKRAPGRVYQMPPAEGPGADNVRRVQARLKELPPVIATYRASLPAVATVQGGCLPLLDRLARMQLNVAAQVQQLQAQNSQQNTAVAMLAAREALQGGTFMSVMDRRRAEEGKAGKMVAQAMSALADQVAATRADDAVALVNSTRDALIAARESIVRAEFERDVDVSAESDAEFLRKVEALRTKCAAMPVFQRASFALELYRRALALADEGRQRLIEAALLPIATEMVMDGAARIRATVAAAGRAGNATKTLNDANSFVNKAVAQAKGRDGSDELAAARVVQGQLELCFLKTGGLDASDPASVSGAQFSNWMSGARKPMMLSADLAIDPKWLTRPMRSTSPTTMPPFQGPSAEIAVKAGKAGAR